MYTYTQNRRSFCAALAAAASVALIRPLRAQSPAVISLAAPQAGAVPEDYLGLSYETAQLSDPTFFSADNHELAALLRALSPSGVLRIGGNSSEFCWWKTAEGQTPPAPPRFAGSDENWMPKSYTAIGPEAVDRLTGFLDATGWKTIYGLNLGTGTPGQAAEQAAYVAHALGSRLLYFQIGNEPEYYSDANNRLRGPDWDFDQYIAQWARFAKAVIEKVPQARFGGPDVGSNADWVVRFAEQAPKLFPGRIVAATGHYYVMGPPDDPRVTVARLLAPDAKVERDVPRMVEAARKSGIGYRMAEGNTCFRGGKPGMSNAFCSALWAADYLLKLASYGCAGVNLHGGDTKLISMSLGGHLPGASVAPDAAQAAQQGSFYTPIAGSRAEGFTARPVLYGMKLAGLLAGGRMRPVTLGAAGNVSAYAADMPDGGTRLVVINKGAAALPVQVAAGSAATLWRLEAPALTATTDVTLAGAAIKPGAAWKPLREERVTGRSGQAHFVVRASSAAILFSTARLA